MAIRLESKVNVLAPAAPFPFGRIKNNTGSNDGTPVNEQVYGDFHQFFAKLLSVAGIVGNDLPENDVNGYQYIQALFAVRDTAFTVMKAMLSQFDADAEGLILSGCVVSGGGPHNITAGIVYLNGEFLLLPSAVGITMPKYIVADAPGESRLYPAKLQATAPGSGQYIKLVSIGSESDRYYKNIGKIKHVTGGGDEVSGATVSYKTEKSVLIDITAWNLNYSGSGQREYGVIHNIPNLRSKYPIIEIALRNDTLTLGPLEGASGAAGSENVNATWYIDASDESANRIVLRVTTGSVMDGTTYDDTSIMRGYIKITYYE